MKHLSFILALPLFFILFTGVGDDSDKPSPQEVMEKVAETFSSHTSMTYNATYRTKYLSEDDTLVFHGKGKQIRVASDTIFGGYIWYSVGDTIEAFYDLDLIYSIWESFDTATTFKAHEGEQFAMTGNAMGDIATTSFLHPERLRTALEDARDIAMTEETFDGRQCWKIEAPIPDAGDYEGVQVNYWIDQERNIILKKNYRVGFQGNYQFNEWVFSDVVFDDARPEELVARNEERLKAHTVIPYERKSPQEYALLPDATVVPDFTGVRYGDDMEVTLSGSKAKLIVLDFWYMSCFPCIQAIPHLEEIYQKYGDKGVEVWGINSVDNREERKKKFPKFLEHNPISYPILFVDHSVDSDYKVTGYPSLYVLNEQRKVVYSQVGFGETTGAKLDSVVAALLNQ